MPYVKSKKGGKYKFFRLDETAALLQYLKHVI